MAKIKDLFFKDKLFPVWEKICLTSVRTNPLIGSLNLHVLSWSLLQICNDCAKHVNYKRYVHSYKVEKLVTYVHEKKSDFLASAPCQLIPARQTK